MPKIKKHTVKFMGKHHELQIYYTSASKFYFKDFPWEVELGNLVKDSFTNRYDTENQLTTRLTVAMRQYEEEVASTEKVIHIHLHTGRLVEMIKTGPRSYSGKGNAKSDTLTQDYGLAFDYKVYYKVTQGDVHYCNVLEDGRKGYKEPYVSMRNKRGVIEIPYTEEAIQLIEGAASTLNQVAERFRDFFYQENFLDQLASSRAGFLLPPKDDNQ